MAEWKRKTPEPPRAPITPLQTLQSREGNAIMRLTAEGRTPPTPPSQQVPLWQKVLGEADRIRSAYMVGVKNADKSAFTGNPLWNEGFWKGAWRGLTKQEDWRISDVIKEEFPEFAREHPTATTLLGAGGDIVTDPLSWLGASAAGKAVGSTMGKGLIAAASPTPEVAMAAERLLPALRYTPGAVSLSNSATSVAGKLSEAADTAIASTVNPTFNALRKVFAKGGSNPAFAKDLRQFRASKDYAKQGVVDEVKDIIKGLTPEQEMQARRLIEAGGFGAPRTPVTSPIKPVTSLGNATDDVTTAYERAMDEVRQRYSSADRGAGVLRESPLIQEKITGLKDMATGRRLALEEANAVKALRERAIPIFDGMPDVQAVIRGEATSAPLIDDVTRTLETSATTSGAGRVGAMVEDARAFNALQYAAKRELDELTAQLSQGMSDPASLEFARQRANDLLSENPSSLYNQARNAKDAATALQQTSGSSRSFEDAVRRELSERASSMPNATARELSAERAWWLAEQSQKPQSPLGRWMQSLVSTGEATDLEDAWVKIFEIVDNPATQMSSATTTFNVGRRLSPLQQQVLDDLQTASKGEFVVRDGQLVRNAPEVAATTTATVKPNIGQDPEYARMAQELANGPEYVPPQAVAETRTLWQQANDMFAGSPDVQAVLRGEAMSAQLPANLTPVQENALAALQSADGGLRLTPTEVFWEFKGGQIPADFPENFSRYTPKPSAPPMAQPEPPPVQQAPTPTLPGPQAASAAEIEQELIANGVDPAVAKAVASAKVNVTDWVPQQYEAAGIPLTTRESYFPHVEAEETPWDKMRGFFKQRPIKTRDRFAQKRKHEGTVDEIHERLGRKLFREDFGVPLAVRKQAAVDVLESKKFLSQTLEKYGVKLQPGEMLPEGYSWISPETGAILKGADAAKVGAVALPNDIAQPLDGITAIVRNQDEAMQWLGRAFIWFRKNWGAVVTVWRPAFHANNFMGGVINNYIGGVRNLSRYVQARNILNRKSGTLVTEAGERIPYDVVYDELARTGTLNSGISGTLEQSLARETEVAFGKGPTLARPLRFYDEKMRQLGRATENELRSTLYIDRRIKGDTAEQAAEKVLDYHFDYSAEGMDAFGRKLKPWVPFYVWLRNNLELQAQEIFKQPGTYVAYERLREGLDKAQPDKPDSMDFAVPLGKVGDRNVSLNMNTPIEDVRNAIENPTRLAFGALTPAFKTAADMYYNTNSFTGAKVRKFEGEKVPFLGAQVDPMLAYGLRGMTGTLGGIEKNITQSIEQGGIEPKQALSLGSTIIPGLGSYNPEETALSRAYDRDKQLQDALKVAAQELGRQAVTTQELENMVAGRPADPNDPVRSAQLKQLYLGEVKRLLDAKNGPAKKTNVWKRSGN